MKFSGVVVASGSVFKTCGHFEYSHLWICNSVFGWISQLVQRPYQQGHYNRNGGQTENNAEEKLVAFSIQDQ